MLKASVLAATLMAACALAGCDNDASRDVEPGEPGTNAGPAELAGPTTPPTEVPQETQRVLPRVAPPARIDEIAASGKTGLWVEPAELCPGRTRDTVVLTWNVTESGAENVVLHVVDDKGAEKQFGHGGPIGERQSGPWAKAGMAFKLRDAQGSEVASVSIEPDTDCSQPG